MANRPRQIKGHVLFDLLTRGIYTTFTRAIKEAVSNAYDAGSESVAITFDPPEFMKVHDPAKLTIQIRDDGQGMSLSDLWGKFASINSQKNPARKDPSTGRYPIGQFGIGSFALVPFSLQLTIYSKKFRSKPIKCVIDSQKLLEKNSDDFPEHVERSVKTTEIDEAEWATIIDSADSGTVIVINGVKRETYQELVSGTGRFAEDEKGLFPKAPFTTGLKEIAWELSTLLPLEYADDPGGVYQGHQSLLVSNNPGIHISLSEVELQRKIYSKQNCEVSTIEYTNAKYGLRARGIIIALPDGTVLPRGANGVILRLNNVGIGNYRIFDLVGNATVRQRITGEVHILEGLHQNLNAPRDNFSGPAYDELRGHLNKALSDLQSRAYSNWQNKREQKKETQKKEVEKSHRRAFDEGQQKGRTSKGLDTARKGQSHQSALLRQKQHNPPRQRLASRVSHTEDDSNNKVGENLLSDTEDNFQDPVVNAQHKKGKMQFNDDHELFKKFRRQAERETIEIVLRALYIAGIAREDYQQIVTTLLSLKE